MSKTKYPESSIDLISKALTAGAQGGLLVGSKIIVENQTKVRNGIFMNVKTSYFSRFW